MAQCLDVPLAQVQPGLQNQKITSAKLKNGTLTSQKVVDMFSDLREYLEMLENASRIDELDLIEYLSQKIAEIWRDIPKWVAPSPKRIITTTGEKANRV